MTQTELFTALLTLGLPVAYSHFKEARLPPFICYLYRYNNDLKADNTNADSADAYDIEFYAAAKDPVNEAAIEAMLTTNQLPYSKTENWISEENMLQVTYEIQITGG